MISACLLRTRVHQRLRSGSCRALSTCACTLAQSTFDQPNRTSGAFSSRVSAGAACYVRAAARSIVKRSCIRCSGQVCTCIWPPGDHRFQALPGIRKPTKSDRICWRDPDQQERSVRRQLHRLVVNQHAYTVDTHIIRVSHHTVCRSRDSPLQTERGTAAREPTATLRCWSVMTA